MGRILRMGGTRLRGLVRFGCLMIIARYVIDRIGKGRKGWHVLIGHRS